MVSIHGPTRGVPDSISATYSYYYISTIATPTRGVTRSQNNTIAKLKDLNPHTNKRCDFLSFGKELQKIYFNPRASKS